MKGVRKIIMQLSYISFVQTAEQRMDVRVRQDCQSHCRTDSISHGVERIYECASEIGNLEDVDMPMPHTHRITYPPFRRCPRNFRKRARATTGQIDINVPETASVINREYQYPIFSREHLKCLTRSRADQTNTTMQSIFHVISSH